MKEVIVPVVEVDIVPVPNTLDHTAIAQSVFMMVTNVVGIIIWSKWGKTAYSGLSLKFSK